MRRCLSCPDSDHCQENGCRLTRFFEELHDREGIDAEDALLAAHGYDIDVNDHAELLDPFDPDLQEHDVHDTP
jgi:hypothetical protein